MVANSLSCILLGFVPWLLITSLSSLSEWLSSCNLGGLWYLDSLLLLQCSIWLKSRLHYLQGVYGVLDDRFGLQFPDGMFELGVVGGKSCSRLGLLHLFLILPKSCRVTSSLRDLFWVFQGLGIILTFVLGFLGSGDYSHSQFLVASSSCGTSWLAFFCFLIAGQAFGVWHS